jgi:hypothetical protein
VSTRRRTETVGIDQWNCFYVVVFTVYCNRRFIRHRRFILVSHEPLDGVRQLSFVLLVVVRPSSFTGSLSDRRVLILVRNFVGRRGLSDCVFRHPRLYQRSVHYPSTRSVKSGLEFIKGFFDRLRLRVGWDRFCCGDCYLDAIAGP